MKRFVSIFVCFLALNSWSFNPYWGVSAGIGFSFGTHQNRIGLHTAAYYNYGFAQANISLNGYYNIQSLALKQKGFEFQFGSGMQLGFGRKDSIRSPFIGLSENNMEHIYSVGYDYMLFLDQQQTSQAGGILSVNIDRFKFATQNDLFGFGDGWRDRFRTGAFLLEYRHDNFKFGLNATLWTDDYSVSKKILDTDFPARFGYKDDRNVKFGGKSVALLSAQVKWLAPSSYAPLNQEAQLNIGIQSERVRNVLQNRIVHDHAFIPEKWISRNPCHIPMEAEGGGQYLYQENQIVKKPSFYFNIGANEDPFY